MSKSCFPRVLAKRICLLATCVLVASSVSLCVAGAEDSLPPAGIGPSEQSPGLPADWRGDADQYSGRTAALRMVGGLFVCLATFFLGARLYRKYAGVTVNSAKRRLRVIERIAVTQKGSVALISVDGQEFLVSMGSDAPRLISKISKGDTSEFIDELCREDQLRVAI